MKHRNLGRLFFAALLLVVALSLTTSVFGQGRGRGGGVGGGRGSGGGAGNAGGPPSGVGVDRGIGNASVRSNGRSDTGLGTASDRSNGRSDAGLERARRAGDNRRVQLIQPSLIERGHGALKTTVDNRLPIRRQRDHGASGADELNRLWHCELETAHRAVRISGAFDP